MNRGSAERIALDVVDMVLDESNDSERLSDREMNRWTRQRFRDSSKTGRARTTSGESYVDLLDELSSEGGPCTNRSETMRMIIDQYNEQTELAKEVERLNRERRQLLEQREEHNELVRYVDDELSYREKGLLTRARWWLFGKNSPFTSGAALGMIDYPPVSPSSMDQRVEIQIPELWDDSEFVNDEWGDLNYLIGPNGTGKTLFSEQLKNQLEQASFSVRYLGADRLIGMVGSSDEYRFTRSELSGEFDLQNEADYRRVAKDEGYSSDAYILLRNKPDLKIRVQAVLSEYFDRDIDLKVEGGFLKPTMIDNNSTVEYEVYGSESHGLKELISLFTIIHDEDSDVIIIDEPELHLHPQYQKYLLREIQDLAGPPGDSSSRTFFLVTHSPSMLDFESTSDILNIYSFRERSQLPSSVSELPEDDDMYPIRNLIPRLDTRHKEALFSRNPLLVEGYTDEQIFSLVINSNDELQSDPGSAIVSLDGKDNINSFFLFCRKLGLEPRIVADLDVLFSGKLRQTLSDVEEVNSQLRNVGHSDLMSTIGSVLSKLSGFIEEIQDTNDLDEPLLNAKESIGSDMDNSDKQYVMYRAIIRDVNLARSVLDGDDVDTMMGTMRTVFGALANCGYYVLEKGELEDYLSDENIPLSGASSDTKSNIFREARSMLIEARNSCTTTDVDSELVDVLSKVLTTREVSLLSHMERMVSQWIHEVQFAVQDGEISSLSDLENHPNVGEERYNRLFEVLDFSRTDDGFECSISVLQSIDPDRATLRFDEETTPSRISF